MKVWENHQVDHINRMPARAHFLTFPTRDKALLGSNGYTHAFKNLNGVWKFMFLDAPEYSPEGFESTEFDTSVVAKHEDAVVEKQVTGSAETKPKETTFKADEFDKVISKSKKKKVVTLKVEKALIPDRFLNLNDEEKSNLIISLLRSWENDYWGK